MSSRPTRTFGAIHPDRDEGPGIIRRRRWGYRAATAVLAAMVAVAVVDTTVDDVDVFGVGDGFVRAADDGYELVVRYPSVTRPAIASPFDIEVRSEDGFGPEVELTVERDFLLLWDVNGIIPAPKEERGDGEVITWVFDAPEGNVMRVSYEARIEPARQSGLDGRVALLDAGEEVLAVTWRTTVLP